MVLEGALERIIVGDLFCDLPLGLYIIRGENVVLIGELVCSCSPHTYIIYYVVCFVAAMALSFNILYFFVQDLSKDDLPPHMQRVTRKEIEKVCEMLLSVISKPKFWICFLLN